VDFAPPRDYVEPAAAAAGGGGGGAAAAAAAAALDFLPPPAAAAPAAAPAPPLKPASPKLGPFSGKGHSLLDSGGGGGGGSPSGGAQLPQLSGATGGTALAVSASPAAAERVKPMGRFEEAKLKEAREKAFQGKGNSLK